MHFSSRLHKSPGRPSGRAQGEKGQLLFGSYLKGMNATSLKSP